MKPVKVIKTQKKAFTCPFPFKSPDRRLRKNIKKHFVFLKIIVFARVMMTACDRYTNVESVELHGFSFTKKPPHGALRSPAAGASTAWQNYHVFRLRAKGYAGQLAFGIRRCSFVFFAIRPFWHCDVAVFHFEISLNRSVRAVHKDSLTKRPPRVVSTVYLTMMYNMTYMSVCRVFHYTIFCFSSRLSPVDAARRSTKIYD